MAKEAKMHWLKLWTRGWLEGSIRFDLTPAQRSVFTDLLAMARESRNPPWVQANETTAYPHSWLASKLNIPLELLEETLELCQIQERITENSTGILVLKFDYYQGQEQKSLTEEAVSEPDDPRLFKYGGRPALETRIYRAKLAKGEEWSIGNTRGKPVEYLLDLAKELGF